MLKVYVETTILSYLTAELSGDLVVAAHQKLTHEWWNHARDRFHLHVSAYVLDEIAAGNPVYAERRLELVNDLPILELDDQVEFLVGEYSKRLGLTGHATADIPHFAYAVAHDIDFLVTWNCKHIANGLVVRRLRKINSELSRGTPLVLTPEELLESPEREQR